MALKAKWLRMSIILILIVIPSSCTSIDSLHAEVIELSKPGYIWFSKCIDEKDLDCIESLGVVGSNGKVIPGKPIWNSSPSIYEVKRGLANNGVYGTTINHPNEVWQLPGLKNEYGNSYVITEFSMLTGASQWYDFASDTLSGASGINNMRFAILASPSSSGFQRGLWGVPLNNFAHKCVTQNFLEEMVCQRTANFDPNQEIRATVRFSKYRAAQVQSNLTNNLYQVMELGNGATKVVVSGKPSERPYFVDSLSLSRDVFQRTQVDAISRQWEVLTQDAPDRFTPKKCINKGIPIVTGNMFSQSSPNWNMKTGELSINVWAPHFDPDGKIYEGYYEGNFTNDYISCLWGLSVETKLAALAISIVDAENGEKSVATTTLTKTNSGVRLIAAGFHYSTAKITFSVTRSPNSQLSSPKMARPKQVTITCVKGSTTKKITSIKPNCPNGFKLKK